MRKNYLHNLIAFLLAALITFTPIIQCSFFSYADSSVPDGYSPAGYNDQVDAFRAYCKSRNLAIEGSVLDAITSVTSSVYQKAVAAAGLDINQLQNDIYKGTGSNINKFYFTATGINAMNRIFAEFLQNEDLEVGDTATESDNNLYTGELFTDSNGNSCLVYIYDTASSINNWYTFPQHLVAEGSYLKYTPQDYVSLYDNGNTNLSFNLYNVTLTGTIKKVTNVGASDYNTYYYSLASRDSCFYNPNNGAIGYVTIGRAVTSGVKYYYPFVFTKGYQSDSNKYCLSRLSSTAIQINNDNFQPVTVYITTNNNTINNNNYEGDTIINHFGEVEQEDPDPIPNPNDDHHTTTDPIDPSDPDSDSNLNFPLLDLDIPSIDWSIGDLSHKFPFSIPFDLVHLIQVFDAEPEAPRFEGTIDFGFTTYDYDINFEEFDTVASVFRTCSLIAFVFGLLYATRYMIKG